MSHGAGDQAHSENTFRYFINGHGFVPTATMSLTTSWPRTSPISAPSGCSARWPGTIRPVLESYVKEKDHLPAERLQVGAEYFSFKGLAG